MPHKSAWLFILYREYLWIKKQACGRNYNLSVEKLHVGVAKGKIQDSPRHQDPS